MLKQKNIKCKYVGVSISFESKLLVSEIRTGSYFRQNLCALVDFIFGKLYISTLMRFLEVFLCEKLIKYSAVLINYQ